MTVHRQTAGKTVGKSELAVILGCNTRTLALWEQEEMPFSVSKEHKARHVYNTARVIDWLIKRQLRDIGSLDLDDERAKLAREQSEYTRLKNEERKGNLIALPDAIVVVQKAANSIRQKIINAKMDDADKSKLLEELNALGDENFETAGGAAAGEETDENEEATE